MTMLNQFPSQQQDDIEIDHQLKRLHHQQQVRQYVDRRTLRYSQAKRRMANTYGYLLESCYQEFAILLLAILHLPLRVIERLTHRWVGP